MTLDAGLLLLILCGVLVLDACALFLMRELASLGASINALRDAADKLKKVGEDAYGAVKPASDAAASLVGSLLGGAARRRQT